MFFRSYCYKVNNADFIHLIKIEIMSQITITVFSAEYFSKFIQIRKSSFRHILWRRIKLIYYTSTSDASKGRG